MIADQIKTNYSFEVPVLVKKAADFQAELNKHPYLKEGTYDLKQVDFTFLFASPAVE